jgi:hypothetical protein
MGITTALAALAAALQPAAPPTQLDLSQIQGVRLSDTEAAATATLSRWGNVTREPGERGAINLAIGRVAATVCEGRIVSVSQKLGTTFHQFAAFAEGLMEVRGAPERPDIFAIDGSRPASDPRGALTISASTIRLSWANAPNYILGFSEVSGEHTVWEALNQPHSCQL